MKSLERRSVELFGVEWKVKTIIEACSIAGFIVKHPLSKNRKIRALTNFIFWQIGARILKKKVAVPWVDDSRFLIGLGETGLSGNAYVGLMEYEDMAFLLHALRSDDVFVDVGANIGAYTILASKVVKSRTIAFEPLPDTVDKLVDQIKINRIDSLVKVRGVGVGASRGALFFTNRSDTTNKVSAAGSGDNTTEVEVSSLDDELDDNLNYFVKIDVEGFELNVLRGAERVLSGSNVVAVIVEMNGSGSEFGFSDNEVHDALVGFGFVSIDYDPRTRLIACLDGCNRRRGNTIYVKNIEDVARRCSSAPKRTIHTADGAQI